MFKKIFFAVGVLALFGQLGLVNPVTLAQADEALETGSLRTEESDLSFRVRTNTQARGFDVALRSAPTDTRQITITSSDEGAAVASTQSLTFEPANWTEVQTVFIRSVIDADNEDEAVTFTLTDTTTQDVITRIVRVNDSLSGGLIVTPATTQTLAFETEVNYEVELELTPSAEVIVTVAGDNAELFSDRELLFTPATWSEPQVVNLQLSPARASLVDDTETLTLRFAVDSVRSAPEFADLEAVRTVRLETEADDSDVEPAERAEEREASLQTPATPILPELSSPQPEVTRPEEPINPPDPGVGTGGAAPEEPITTPGELPIEDPIEDLVEVPGDLEGGFGQAAPEEENEVSQENTSQGGPTQLIRTGGF